MSAPHHLVERVRFDLAVNSRALGLSVQERLSAFHRERLAAIMSECFDTVLDANEHVSIPRLDLDLGDVALEHLERDVESRFRRELMSALQRARSGARRERIERASPRPTGRAAAERLIAYVSDGTLDWTMQGTAVDLDALLQAAMDDPSTSSGTLARQLVMTRAGRRRLAQQFSRASRRRVAAALRELRNAPHTIMPDEWDESDRTHNRGVALREPASGMGSRRAPMTSGEWHHDAADDPLEDVDGVRAILRTGDVPVAWLVRTSARHLVALLSGSRDSAGGATPFYDETPSGPHQPVLSRAAAQRIAETLVRYVPVGALLALLRRRQPHWRATVHAVLRAERESSAEQRRDPRLRGRHGERAHAAHESVSRTRSVMMRLLVDSLTHSRSAPPSDVSAATARLASVSDTSPASAARAAQLSRDPLHRLRRLLRYGATDAATIGERMASLERRLVHARRARWHDWHALARAVASDAVMRARLLAWCSIPFATQLLTDASNDADAAHAHDEPAERSRMAPFGNVATADVLAFLEHGSLPDGDSRRALLRTSTWAWMRNVLRSPTRDALVQGMRTSAHTLQIANTLERTLPARHLEHLVQLLAPGLAGFATSYRRAVQLSLTHKMSTSRAATLRAVSQGILRYALDTPREAVSARGMVAAITERMSPDDRSEHLQRLRDTARRRASHAPRYAALDDVVSDMIAELAPTAEPTGHAQRDATTESLSTPVVVRSTSRGAATRAVTADGTSSRHVRGRDDLGRFAQRLRFGRTSVALDSASVRHVEVTLRHARRQRPAAWSALARTVVSDPLSRARLASEFSLGLSVAVFDAAGAHGAAYTSADRSSRERRRRTRLLCQHLAALLAADEQTAAQSGNERRAIDAPSGEHSTQRTVQHTKGIDTPHAAAGGAVGGTGRAAPRIAESTVTPFTERDDAPPLVAHASPRSHSRRWWRRLVQEALLHAAGDQLTMADGPDAPSQQREDTAIAAHTPAAHQTSSRTTASLPQVTLRRIVRRALERAAEVRGISVLELSTRLRARAWYHAARSAERAERRGVAHGTTNAAASAVDRTVDRPAERTVERAGEPTVERAVERALADTLAAHPSDALRASARHAPTRTAPAPRASESTPIHVDDAGLVILWPMFSHFFSQLQLTNKGTFVNAAAAERAVLLLRHLVTGESEAPEPALSLDKLLCGVPWGTPVPRRIVLTDQEGELSTQLLTVVTQRWAPLANTSLAGLRESFLQREGRLVEHDDAWQLTVATRAYDMLLDRLPWNLSPVRLPWMPTLLHVRWRS